MKKFILSIYWLHQLMHASGQNYTLDSLKDALYSSKTDTARITALANLGDFYFNCFSWSDLKKKDTSCLMLKKAIRLTEKNKLNEREEELLDQLATLYLTSNTNQKDSILPIARNGLALAKSAGLKTWEALFTGWTGVGYFLGGKHTDSALGFMQQGLDIARENKLPVQQALLLSCYGIAYTDPNPDSARQLFSRALYLAEANQLTVQQIEILRHLAELYADSNYDTALVMMHKALALAEKNGLKGTTIGILYKLIAPWSSLYEEGALEEHFNLGTALARQIHAQHSESDFLNNYATVQTNRGNYTSALAAYLKALDIMEHTDDQFGMATVLYNIGNMYFNVQDYRQSLSYLFKANEKTKKIQDSFNFVFSLEGIGHDYVKLKMPDSARIFLKKARDFGNFYYGRHVYGGLLNNIGQIYADLGDDSLAMIYFRKSFPNFNPTNEDLNICESLTGMAKLFKKSGHEDSAFIYATRAFPIAQKNNFPQYILEASSLLADHYKSMHLMDSAFAYQGIAMSAHESLFSQEKIKELDRIEFENQRQQQELKQKLADAQIQYQNRLKNDILIGGLVVFIILAVGLWRKNVYKQKAYAVLDSQKKIIDMQKAKVEQALEELKSMQSQLIHSEKMASLGGLTAGIAHEIENPLNFVNNFSEVNTELIEEMQGELNTGNNDEAIVISNYIKENQQKINFHGKRADAIVKGMLQHARPGTGQKEPANINGLADECLRLSYHSVCSKDKSFQATLQTDFDKTIGMIPLIQQDIVRVLINLFNNAFYAVNEKRKQHPEGYEPTVSVHTKKVLSKVEIRVKDNGTGIPQKLIDKIFQPFFTTKPAGEGTGLGLSLSYDVVKVHGGEIKVDSRENTGSEFIVELPLKE